MESVRKFNRNTKMFKMLSDLIGLEQPYEDILDFFDGQEEVVFAMLLQNMMHPKNSNRREAIQSKKYIEFMNVDQAHNYIDDIIRTNLTNELRQAESSVMEAF